MYHPAKGNKLCQTGREQVQGLKQGNRRAKTGIPNVFTLKERRFMGKTMKNIGSIHPDQES